MHKMIHIFNYCYLLLLNILLQVSSYEYGLEIAVIEYQFYARKSNYIFSHTYDEKGIAIPVWPPKKGSKKVDYFKG